MEPFCGFSLQFAEDLANLLHHPAPRQWREVAERLKIPFDPASQYHPEYDGYLKGGSSLTDWSTEEVCDAPLWDGLQGIRSSRLTL